MTRNLAAMADPAYREKLESLTLGRTSRDDSHTVTHEATAATIEQTEHRDGRVDLTIKPRHLRIAGTPHWS